jgi:hypothetical protein
MRETDNKPETVVHPLTFEEMTEAQRVYYAPQRRARLPETIHEYDPFKLYDSEVAPCHRPKS